MMDINYILVSEYLRVCVQITKRAMKRTCTVLSISTKVAWPEL